MLHVDARAAVMLLDCNGSEGDGNARCAVIRGKFKLEVVTLEHNVTNSLTVVMRSRSGGCKNPNMYIHNYSKKQNVRMRNIV